MGSYRTGTLDKLPLLLVVIGSLSSFVTAARSQESLPGDRVHILTTQQWIQDLDFFESRIEKHHIAPFHATTRQLFEEKVNALRSHIDALNRDEVFVRMDQIANSIGDGHTYIRIPPNSPAFPVRFENFGGDFRLVSVVDTPEAKAALGGKLIRIDDMPIEQVRIALLTLTPADEYSSLRQLRAAALLREGLVLHGLGMTSGRDNVTYTLLTEDGEEVKLRLASGAAAQNESARWLNAVASPPLWLQRPDQGFWCQVLQPTRTGYCAFRSYEDLKHTSHALSDMLRRQQLNNIVIDLRLNKGGDFALGLKYVVKPLRRNHTLNRKGHLFVLIGAKTFSAAMSNAAHFRAQTAALLVGQPIGEKPNSYQEARDAVLPNSHWNMRYSTRFYHFADSQENVIRPDVDIPLTWDAYRAGRDPVMDWVLSQVSNKK